MSTPESLEINGKRVYYSELVDLSYRETVPLDGYEEKTLEFCSKWLTGVQEFTLTTSGTTGLPKAVVLQRSQMEASAKLTAEYFKLEPNDIIYACLNTEFIGGLMQLVRAFELQLNVIIVSPLANPFALYGQNIPDFQFISLVPYQVHALLQQGFNFDYLAKCKAVLLGGAPVSAELEEQLQQTQLPFYHSYSMTETCSHVAIRQLNGKSRSSKFRPLPGIKIWTNAKNCICIQGSVTDNKVVETHDLVEIDENGDFYLQGRYDDIINTGGVKVNPTVIEPIIADELKKSGFNGRFFLTGLPHTTLGQEVTLVLETIEFSKMQELLEILNQRLPKFEVPRNVLCIPQFNETETGKINKTVTLHSI